MTLSTAVSISLEDGKPVYKRGARVPDSSANMVKGPIPHDQKNLKKMKKKDKDENEKIKDELVKLKGRSKKKKKKKVKE